MAKVEYKTDLTMLATVQKKVLVALIGTMEKPMYALFYDPIADSFIVENKEGIVFSSSVFTENLEERARELVSRYEKLITPEEEEEEEEEDFYCNNPYCSESLVINPIYDGMDYMCPSCGEALDHEEESGLLYDKILDIAYSLWSYIQYSLCTSNEKYKETLEELEDWGVEQKDVELLEMLGES